MGLRDVLDDKVLLGGIVLSGGIILSRFVADFIDNDFPVYVNDTAAHGITTFTVSLASYRYMRRQGHSPKVSGACALGAGVGWNGAIELFQYGVMGRNAEALQDIGRGMQGYAATLIYEFIPSID